MVQPADREFYAGLPLFEAFEGVADEANYRPLPDGWWLAVADIVNSTGAIAEGRYKSVNMAGASVISALMNGLDEKNLAFVFGGDGALAAVPEAGGKSEGRGSPRPRHGWRRNWGLELRRRNRPGIRRARQRVRHACRPLQGERGGLLRHVFGGGASWAEAEMKAGRYRSRRARPARDPT